MAAALLGDGVGGEPGVDRAALEALARVELAGGGLPVGEMRAVLPAS